MAPGRAAALSEVVDVFGDAVGVRAINIDKVSKDGDGGVLTGLRGAGGEGFDDVELPFLVLQSRKIQVAAASTVAALLTEAVRPSAGSKVACVLSGGNLNLSALKNKTWN